MSSRSGVTARQRDRQLRSRWLFGSIVVMIVVAFGIAIVLSAGGDSASKAREGEVGTVTVSGAALPVFPGNGQQDAAVGLTSPTVTGRDFDDQPVRVADGGRPKIVMFVAHWCPHCRREVPLLAPELRSIMAEGVDVVTVSTTVNPNAPNYPPSEWLEGVDWAAPVIADDADSTAAQAFGLASYPYFVFVDRENKVAGHASGELPVSDVLGAAQQLAALGT